MLEFDTPHDRHGRTCTIRPAEPRGALVLDHGTGGGVGARDLVVATEVATGRRLTVALVEQPCLSQAAGRLPPRTSSTRPGSIASPAGP